MKKSMMVLLIVSIILLMGIAGLILGSTTSITPTDPIRDRMFPKRSREINATRNATGDFTKKGQLNEQFDLESYMIIKSGITMVNIAISLILIGLYINIYRRIKSDFTLGLIVVMFAFLVYAITSNPLFHILFGFRGYGLGPFQMLPEIFATLALSILLYLSLK